MCCLEKQRETKTFSARWTGVEVPWWKEEPTAMMYICLGVSFCFETGFLEAQAPFKLPV